MDFKKFKLVPADSVRGTEQADPFENVHAQRARAGLQSLQRDVADGFPRDENERIARQQKLLRYKNDFRKAIEAGRDGTLQETFGVPKPREESPFENAFREFLQAKRSKQIGNSEDLPADKTETVKSKSKKTATKKLTPTKPETIEKKTSRKRQPSPSLPPLKSKRSPKKEPERRITRQWANYT